MEVDILRHHERNTGHTNGDHCKGNNELCTTVALETMHCAHIRASKSHNRSEGNQREAR